MVGVGCKGEAGRSPGALANPARPESLQSRGDPADRRAGEATAALGRGEMIAEDFLNPGDAVAESLEIRFGGAGQDLHERAAADFARRVGGETRQSGKRPPFLFAMRALDARVQDQKNAPIPGESSPTRPPAGSRCSALCQRRRPSRRARTTQRPRPNARRDRAGARPPARRAAVPPNRRNAVAIASAS